MPHETSSNTFGTHDVGAQYVTDIPLVSYSSCSHTDLFMFVFAFCVPVVSFEAPGHCDRCIGDKNDSVNQRSLLQLFVNVPDISRFFCKIAWPGDAWSKMPTSLHKSNVYNCLLVDLQDVLEQGRQVK